MKKEKTPYKIEKELLKERKIIQQAFIKFIVFVVFSFLFFLFYMMIHSL